MNPLVNDLIVWFIIGFILSVPTMSFTFIGARLDGDQLVETRGELLVTIVIFLAGVTLGMITVVPFILSIVLLFNSLKEYKPVQRWLKQPLSRPKPELIEAQAESYQEAADQEIEAMLEVH